jgi:hypothetical protein
MRHEAKALRHEAKALRKRSIVMRTKFVFGFVAFLLSACSSSSEPVANGEAECERIVNGACARMVVCGAEPTNAQCAHDMDLDCGSSPFAGKDVDSELTDQCLAAFNALSCSAFQVSPFEPPDACMTWAAQYHK